MEEKFGIENLKKVLFLAAELGNVGDKIGRSKGHPDRLLPLLSLFDELTAFMTVDFQVVNKELADLTAVEKEELLAEMKAKFDIVDDKLEIVFEKSIVIVANAYDMYKSINDLYEIIRK